MAGHLWGGETSGICGPPAAAVWGAAGIPRTGIEVAVFGSARRANGSPLRVRNLDARLATEIVVVDRIPVTSPRLTVLNLAGDKHPRAERALDDCMFRKLTSPAELWLLYDQEWTYGRRGIAILRGWLVDRSGTKPTQTDLEDLFLGIVDRYSLPRPERQYRIDLFGEWIRVDFAYPRARLTIECDSYSWHGIREAFDRDRRKDNLLRMAGWDPRRFTWPQLKFDPDYVAAAVRSGLGPSGC